MPFYSPQPTICWGDYCYSEIPKPHKEDTLEAWHAALEQGPLAIESYLHRFNYIDHGPRCQYKDLPPSVLRGRHGVDTHYEIEEALAVLHQVMDPA
jgi:hypothetical protein